MEIDHEFNIYGELILKARVGGNLIKRRYLYYTLKDAKKHFKTYLNEILP
jgi:hypothetical protein